MNLEFQLLLGMAPMRGNIIDYVESKNKSPLMKKKSSSLKSIWQKNHRRCSVNQKTWQAKGEGTQWSDFLKTSKKFSLIYLFLKKEKWMKNWTQSNIFLNSSVLLEFVCHYKVCFNHNVVYGMKWYSATKNFICYNCVFIITDFNCI